MKLREYYRFFQRMLKKAKVDYMNKKIFLKICSIKNVNNTWTLYDCEGKKLGEELDATPFPSLMNRRYRAKRKNTIEVDDVSCVWCLKGENDNWIQVGRTKNLTNLLSNDVKEDIKKIFSHTGKYGKLNEKYSELTFYEINSIMEHLQSAKGALSNEKNS